MAIRVIEDRKKDPAVWDVGEYSDDQISAAVDAANQLPAASANPNMIRCGDVWPVLLMPVNAAALDFGNVRVETVRLGDLIASQWWIRLDRLIDHIRQPGTRGDDTTTPFTQMPLVAEGNIIIDGHHTLTALWLLAGSDLTVDVWMLPIGIVTGHPR